MKEHTPSRTAYRVAMRRAAHQLFDDPLVLDDPLALPILGADGEAQVHAEARRGSDGRIHRAMRAFMAVRSRVAEDALAIAMQHGVQQYVVLGAGLDTSGFRAPASTSAIRTFEVDHPTTQGWKRERLAEAGIDVPANVTFVDVDFMQQRLEERLTAHGFDASQPAFFSWLGVTPYLSEAAAMDTLRFVERCGPRSGIVFDYAVDRKLLSFTLRLAYDYLAARVALLGEPFTCTFDPDALARALRDIGFTTLEDQDGAAMNARFFSARRDELRVGSLGRVMTAWR